MEQRYLGNSGFKVPVLCFGTGTFGGKGPLFSHWGKTDVTEATRLLDICMESGVNFFDTADVYSDGVSEEILGAALKGRRDKALISTKTTLPMGQDPLDAGSSRWRMIRSVEGALRRLQTDYIDLLHLHAFDAFTPQEEVLSTLDTLVRQGKVRYIGASNFSGWELMKALSVSDRYGYPRHISHQVYYSLVGREYEWELMPLARDQRVGGMIWSPLGWGRLTGKVRRGQALPEGSRLHDTAKFGPAVDDERLYRVVDALDEVAADSGKSIPQIALNWLLRRPTVSSVIIGARNERQLLDNIAAASWVLSESQMDKLDVAGQVVPPYPYFQYRNQESFRRINPPMFG